MTKFYLVLIAAFLFFSLKTFAQGGVPPAYRGDYNRMMANANNNWMNMNMTRMMNQNWYGALGYQVNIKYDFKVTMKDSSVKIVSSKIYVDTLKHKSYLIYVNKALKRSDPNREQKIYADETVRISRDDVDDYIVKGTVNGFATDSCWLFKVVQGKINAYSFLSETSNIDETYLRAFQIDAGRVMKLDSVSLDPVVKPNENAYKPFLKGKFYKAITKYNADFKKSEKKK